MSIIAVSGVPIKWNLQITIQTLKRVIKGPFEGLNFGPGKSNTKILYLRLSETLDPVRVMESISRAAYPQHAKLHAYVSNNMPDIPLASKKMKKKSLSKRTQIAIEPPHQVIQRTHHELLLEIQYKYPGLFNLSRKTGHKLLEEIAKVIFDRVKNIMGANLDTRQNCFKLSSNYRKSHPHFGDFQLILSTLHALQDESGAPRTQILEKELLQHPAKPCTAESIPFEKVQSAYNKYSDRIVKAMAAHVTKLDSKIVDGDSEETIARKKVREELKKMSPYMPTIVRHVVTKHFTPQETPMHRIRIYGEPFLPSKDAMSPFVHRYHAGASRVIRHPRMYNLLMFKIPDRMYAQLTAMDGTVVNGAKLVIRSDIPTYEASPELRSEMSAALGGPRGELVLSMEDIEDDDLEIEDVEL